MTKKPYLSEIDANPEATKHTIEFVRYLGRSFGAAGALNALRYYRDLGWVSEDAFEDLKDHIQGLSTDELSQDTDVEDPSDIDEVADTTFGVLAESLRYISKIAGDDFHAESVNVDVAETRVKNAQNYFEFGDDDDGNDTENTSTGNADPLAKASGNAPDSSDDNNTGGEDDNTPSEGDIV